MFKEAFLRQLLRWVHIIGGVIVMCYIYSPFSRHVGFQVVMKFAIIPLLTLTGLWIWKFKQFNKFFKIN